MIYNKTTYPSSYGRYSYSVSNFLAGIESKKYDEGLQIPRKAVSSYNFDFSGGALKSSVGFFDALIKLFDPSALESIKHEIDNIGSIIKVFIYRNYSNDLNKRQDKLLLLSHDLSLYILNLEGNNNSIYKVRNVFFTSIPSAISYRLNGKDVLILTSETDNMIVYDGENLPYEVLDAPRISSMDLHYERLFVTTIDEKARLWFSDDLDPTMWSIDLSEAGFIEMVDERGALNRVISFNDYLYIFRDYGISRLTAFGDQEGFSVSHLYVSSSKIFPNSVSVCGDKIIFLSSDGLYSFDGYNTIRLLDGIKNTISRNNTKSIGAFFEGKYYLACNLQFDSDADILEEGYLNNALLVYDVKSHDYKIVRGVDIIDIKPVIVGGIEKLYLCARNSALSQYKLVSIDDSGTFMGDVLKKVWKTGFYHFESNHKSKCLRSISLFSSGDAQLLITSDTGEEKRIKIVSGENKYNCLVFGGMFKFEFISSSKDIQILSPELSIVIGGSV